MRPCKLKLNKKQKDYLFLLNFFLIDKVYCKIGNFLTKMLSVMLRTLFPIISVLRLECLKESLSKNVHIGSTRPLEPP